MGFYRLTDLQSHVITAYCKFIYISLILTALTVYASTCLMKQHTGPFRSWSMGLLLQSLLAKKLALMMRWITVLRVSHSQLTLLCSAEYIHHRRCCSWNYPTPLEVFTNVWASGAPFVIHQKQVATKLKHGHWLLVDKCSLYIYLCAFFL